MRTEPSPKLDRTPHDLGLLRRRSTWSDQRPCATASWRSGPSHRLVRTSHKYVSTLYCEVQHWTFERSLLIVGSVVKKCHGRKRTRVVDSTPNCSATRSERTEPQVRSPVSEAWEWDERCCCSRGEERRGEEKTREENRYCLASTDQTTQLDSSRETSRVKVKLGVVGGTVGKCEYSIRKFETEFKLGAWEGTAAKA